MAAVEEALDGAGASARDVERFVHGMTVGTNALLEGRVARTALLATEGFTDLEELGRQARAELYRLCAGHPPPLVPAELRVAVPERTGPGRRAARAGRGGAAGGARRAGCRGGRGLPPVGVPPPGPRAAGGGAGRGGGAGIHVSTSHETAGVFREYERCATTVVDAALSPLLRGYLERLTGRARDAGLPGAGGDALERRNGERRRWRPGTPRGRCCRDPPEERWERRGWPGERRRRRARHGRHVVRRVADRRRSGRREQRARGRRAGAGAADGGRAHGRRRRRVDRVAGLGRRAPGGAALGGRRSRARRATAAAARSRR